MPWYLERQLGIESSLHDVARDVWNGNLTLFGVRIGPLRGLALRFERVSAQAGFGAWLHVEATLPRGLQVNKGEIDARALTNTLRDVNSWADVKSAPRGSFRPELVLFGCKTSTRPSPTADLWRQG